MAAIIASIAAVALIGTTFYVLISAARARYNEKRETAFEAVILEFKPRERQAAGSGRR